MKKALAAALVALTAGWAVAAPPQEPVKGGAVSVAETNAVVKVDKVDRKGNTVTIKDSAGDKIKVAVPPEVKSLKDIQAGSVLKIRYLQSVALTLAKPGIPPAAHEETVTLVPKNGSGEAVVNVKEITAMVQDIDKDQRMLTVKMPDGTMQKLKVPENVEGFDRAKVGDTVALQYTDAVALAAAKQGKGAKTTTPGR